MYMQGLKQTDKQSLNVDKRIIYYILQDLFDIFTYGTLWMVVIKDSL